MDDETCKKDKTELKLQVVSAYSNHILQEISEDKKIRLCPEKMISIRADQEPQVKWSWRPENPYVVNS